MQTKHINSEVSTIFYTEVQPNFVLSKQSNRYRIFEQSKNLII